MREESGSTPGLPVTQIDSDSTKISWSVERPEERLALEHGTQLRSGRREYLSCRIPPDTSRELIRTLATNSHTVVVRVGWLPARSLNSGAITESCHP